MVRRLLPWAAVLALVLAAVATAGWGRGSSPASEHRVRSTPSPTARPIASTADEARRLVRGLTLRTDDLPGGYGPVLRRGTAGISWSRDRVCGWSMPGGPARLARAAVAYGSAVGGIRQRVVAYRHGVAGLVVDRMRKAAPSCTRPVAPGQVELPATMALWVARRDRIRRTTVQTIVLRRGDVLTVLAVDDRGGRLALRLARVIGRRLLDRLPDADAAAAAATLGPPDWVRSVG